MKCKRITRMIVFIVLMLAIGFAWAGEEQPLTNGDIVKLTKLSMGDDVIIAKIKAAKAVKFDLSIDDLIKLKESGVSGPVITAMLDRSNAGVGGKTTQNPAVALVTKSGEPELKGINGDLKTMTAPFVGQRRWIEFSGGAAKLRIKDKKPSILVKLDRDPHNARWLVKLSPWDKYQMRVVEMPSIGQYGGHISNAPEEASNVDYASEEVSPGRWKITPKKPLEPGEYGIFLWEGTPVVYDFGIDKG